MLAPGDAVVAKQPVHFARRRRVGGVPRLIVFQVGRVGMINVVVDVGDQSPLACQPGSAKLPREKSESTTVWPRQIGGVKAPAARIAAMIEIDVALKITSLFGCSFP